jgi:hypothetical protein
LRERRARGSTTRHCDFDRIHTRKATIIEQR